MNTDTPNYSRSAATGKQELRGDAPVDLVYALDALAFSENMNRTAYVNKVLAAHVEVELHKASVLHSMLRDNPLLPQHNRRKSDQDRGDSE